MAIDRNVKAIESPRPDEELEGDIAHTIDNLRLNAGESGVNLGPISRKILEFKISRLESAGGKIVDKKADINQEVTSIGRQIQSAEKDLETFQKRMEATLAPLENDPHLQDELEMMKLKIADEEVQKRSIVDDLRAKQEGLAREKDETAEIMDQKLGFSDKKEGLRLPIQEKLEETEIAMERYQSLYDECRGRHLDYSKRIAHYQKSLKTLGKSDAEKFIAEKFKQALKDSEKKLKDFIKKEEQLKERLEMAREQKRMTEAYLKRIDRAGRSPEELRAFDREAKDRQASENEIKAVCGGANAYRELIGSLDQDVRANFQSYLSLAPEDRRGMDLKFDLSQLQGKDSAEQALYISTFADQFEEEVMIMDTEDWSEVLFGQRFSNLDQTRRNFAQQALNRLPKNFYYNDMSEDWAVRWYVEYKKAASPSPIDESLVRSEAKGIIENRRNNL
jgi:hypothetical protein